MACPPEEGEDVVCDVPAICVACALKIMVHARLNRGKQRGTMVGSNNADQGRAGEKRGRARKGKGEAE